ncbi:MAG: YihY/virulence factor BrkB family protein [Chloroflexi bacterium]|nr:YihY/virulence factor BrkB family protein [Chloroflexota bacterium]
MDFSRVKDEGQAFVKKFGNDWCTNLAGLLAYNFLGAIFPLLLGILALAALVLPGSVVQSIGTSLNNAIPAAANGANGLNIDFNSILATFHGSSASKLTLIVSFIALLWTGSSLFGVMENCFSIIFRTKDRDFIWQKLMSVAMILIFAVLAPLSFVASSISGSYQQITKGIGNIPGLGLLFAAGGYLIGVAFAFGLFFCIFFIVPNVKMAWSHTWRGALVAAVLFEAASLVFPVYTTHFMGKSQFGSIAGLLAVLTLWFWVISLILLVGAEVNSYFALGQRATADDLPGVLHGMKVHGEMRRGEDETTPGAQQRVMEDVQPSSEKKREGSPSSGGGSRQSSSHGSNGQRVSGRWG